MAYSAIISRIWVRKVNKPFVVTVSQLNRRIALILKGEKAFTDISIRGEISNFTYHSKSGHIYFTLKDETSSLKAVMFRSYAENLSFTPENGMAVIVRGSVQCFERDGIYQLYAYEIAADGEGDMANEFEVLKKKLDEEGLFKRKRPIPAVPKRIIVITSDTGAALQDILNILNRRYPFVKVLVIPAMVQGEYAPDSIASAFKKAEEIGGDTIIFGRGGGSAEDLSAFNTETVARAVFASSIPTISAVGHETDFTIADFVADLRAPTPSAAAELSVPDIKDISDALISYKDFLYKKTIGYISEKSLILRLKASDIRKESPYQKLKANEEKLRSIRESLSFSMNKLIESKESHYISMAAVIGALNPLSVLSRGYSITYKGNSPVFSADELDKGDMLTIRLNSGEITAIVEETRKGDI